MWSTTELSNRKKQMDLLVSYGASYNFLKIAYIAIPYALFWNIKKSRIYILYEYKVAVKVYSIGNDHLLFIF